MDTTVGTFVRNERGINNIEIQDTQGNILSNSYEPDNQFQSYFDKAIKSSTIEDRGNFGFVATLVI